MSGPRPPEWAERQRAHAVTIRELKRRLGSGLLILTHHYQRPEIVEAGDVRGDSLGLSRTAAESAAARIVFCGVHFMAESAAILAGEGQTVHHPDPMSGCPMSDMADIEDVERAFEELDALLGPGAVVPVTYVNSSADVKAVTGRRDGSCCTSSNAEKVLSWALGTGRKALFLPDEHLGANTAARMGVPPNAIVRWDFSLPLGGNAPGAIEAARLILWRGYCHVHTHFTAAHVAAARARFPGARVIVHPECRPEVVDAADEAGSTERMVRYVAAQPAGSVIVVGTELNLVRRLAAEHPDRTVVELARSMCPNMFKITLAKLRATLEGLPGAHVVTVRDEVRLPARAALDRMLALS